MTEVMPSGVASGQIAKAVDQKSVRKPPQPKNSGVYSNCATKPNYPAAPPTREGMQGGLFGYSLRHQPSQHASLHNPGARVLDGFPCGCHFAFLFT